MQLKPASPAHHAYINMLGNKIERAARKHEKALTPDICANLTVYVCLMIAALISLQANGDPRAEFDAIADHVFKETMMDTALHQTDSEQ